MSFRDTGRSTPAENVTANAGSLTSVLIAAPGEGKRIVIFDIIVHGTGDESFRSGNYIGSNLMFKLKEGSHSFAAGFALPVNKALDVNSGTPGTTLAIAVTYYIKG